MSEQMNLKVIEAAGGIVEHATSPSLLIAVVYRDRYGGAWGLPKGKREAGESWQETALREVQEEISLSPIIVGVAGATAYLAEGTPKLVLYWRMRADPTMQPFVPNEEVKKLEWLTPEHATERLTHREEVELVRRVFEGTARARNALYPLLGKQLVPIFSRRRWKRLASAIDVYDKELQDRAKSSEKLPDGLATIQEVLKSAREALENGDIDLGWKSLMSAQRLELNYLTQPELNAVGWAMRSEADKLDGWRKAAVVGLLSVEDGGNQGRERVFRAAEIRDEHYNNVAYREGLRRDTALLLALILLAVVLSLLWMSCHGFPWPFSDPTDKFRRLLSVAMVGLLGATISAITDRPKTDRGTRIPEMASAFQVTLLRLLMGPASAIVLSFVVQSDVYKFIFQFGTPNEYTILAIAFVAGFSERLVLRVVEAIAGKP
jgi:ADP-ribose pyrophosphatase YjhB (NUDIX family)